MIRKPLPSFFLTFFLSFSSFLFAEATHSLGIGAHYWQVLDDIDDTDFDDSGLSYILAYRYDGGLLAFQAEIEAFPSEFAGTTEEVYSPQVIAILGGGIYAGIGAGILYSDGEFADAPFFLIRAGFSVIAFGPFIIDVNANYIFTDFDNLSSSDIDSNTITLGAMVRYEF